MRIQTRMFSGLFDLASIRHTSVDGTVFSKNLPEFREISLRASLHCRRDHRNDVLVERVRDDHVGGGFRYVVGERAGDRELHFFGNLLFSGFEDALENSREGEDVVQLVGEIATTGGHDGGTSGFGFFRHDFRGGVRHGEDDGVLGHGADVVTGEEVRLGKSDENVRSHDHVLHAAVATFEVGDFNEFLLCGIESWSVLGKRALGVAGDDVLHARLEEELDGRGSRGARSIDDDLDFVDLLAGDLERVVESGERDDGGTVLVVMHERDVEFGLEAFFDFETARGGDVFEVDAAEGRGDGLDRRDDFLSILRGQYDGESVDSGEFLEEHAFAFHDRESGEGADVAKAENGGTVGNDGDGTPLEGEGVGEFRFRRDGAARFGYARGIGEREVVAGVDADAGGGFELSADLGVELERFCEVVHLGNLKLLVSLRAKPAIVSVFSFFTIPKIFAFSKRVAKPWKELATRFKFFFYVRYYLQQ